jgi:hypothetical protein
MPTDDVPSVPFAARRRGVARAQRPHHPAHVRRPNEGSVVLGDEDEGGLDAHEPATEGVREPVSLVERHEIRAVEARLGVSGERADAMEVAAVGRLRVCGDHPGPELVLLADLHAVRDDDLAARAAPAERGDAREDLLDETRRGVGPAREGGDG